MTKPTFRTTKLQEPVNKKHEAHQAMLAEHRRIKEVRKRRSSTMTPRWHKLNGEVCSDKSIDWVPSRLNLNMNRR